MGLAPRGGECDLACPAAGANRADDGGGPFQILLVYHQARPGIGRRAGWVLVYLVLAMTVCGAFKHLVAHTGQLKQLLGEREWCVTPRG